ncbi:hypothetical protein MACH09_46260 [Vibrio sp. MACH09]|uniref:hypothetical protein n=1 Tax=Vibrio sp. MACH09 TaxID=3025122 RepID=UPI0027929869|nr:hypothetical protein [Vibrio sp. MACH09]GLO64118.1 hypothetical protein MACH09_46260 [Vibrio sp. MACH09]
MRKFAVLVALLITSLSVFASTQPSSSNESKDSPIIEVESKISENSSPYIVIDGDTTPALIGVVAFIIAQILNDLFIRHRKSVEDRKEKLNVASFAKSELINISRHHEANILKLESLIKAQSFDIGTHYEKMKLSDRGLVALELHRLNELPNGLTQDLLRFSLFCRNNEIEIVDSIETLEGNGNNELKLKRLNELLERFQRTVFVSGEIVKNLDLYQANPKAKVDRQIEWPDEYWKLQEDQG